MTAIQRQTALELKIRVTKSMTDQKLSDKIKAKMFFVGKSEVSDDVHAYLMSLRASQKYAIQDAIESQLDEQDDN